MPIRIILISASLLLLFGCSTPEQRAEKLADITAKAEANLPEGFERVTGDDLLAMSSDRTVTGVSFNNPDWTYIIYRSVDGTATGTSTNGSDNSNDTGKWSIESDQMCHQWKSWQDGRKNCDSVYFNGEYHMMITQAGKIVDGKKQKWTNVAGNTEGL